MKRQAEEVQAEKRRRSAKIASAVGEQQVMAELLRDARILLLALTACLRRVAVYGQVRRRRSHIHTHTLTSSPFLSAYVSREHI